MTETELDYRRLFEASPDNLLVMLPDAPRFTMVAATEARLVATLTTRAATIGHGIFELFPDNPDDPTADGTRNLRASLERVLATRAPDTMAIQKYDIRRPDGSFEVRYWSPRNIPLLSATGEVLYIFHRAEDVTDLVRASERGDELQGRTRAMEQEVVHRSRELATANAELRAANVKLGELDAAKTAFFSNVSHELRTPLTLMLGPLEDGLTDRAAPLAEAQRTRVALAHDNALRLLKLVNALLDFSRLEAGRLQPRFAPTDLATVTAELAAMFDSAIARAGLDFVVECPPLGEPVWVDRDLWEKIVPNLVSNAFKYTTDGTVSVRLREEPTSVVLEVADTGIGIAADELPRVFDRFHRVAGAVGRTHEGTGIGLALVRELVELHGGQVTVTSAVGVGTTFRVAIPKGRAHLPSDAVTETPVEHASRREAVAHATEAARWNAVADPRSPSGTASAPPNGTRAAVLVVDDNPDLRAYTASLLAPSYDVRTAADGIAALEAVRTHPPDIVVSDVMMPRLDGVGLVRELRADPATASLPIILVSARAGEDSTVAGIDAGSDDYLTKPFSARELVARVRTHVELARSRKAWITDLQRANAELDAFSSSVSHDLRAPLRAIEGFSHFLIEDYAPQLDARAHDYLARITGSVKKMSTLIDDLLKLAKIARATVDAEPIDLSALATTIVEDLRRTHPERDVTVEIAPGVVGHGDRRLVNVALTNLIDNAWKYTGRRTAGARIEVGRTVASEPTFFVRDNGAGFDMAHAKRLFQPFNRLHSPVDFPGTGVGLATVERVVNRHGGRIWAESTVGEGATFYFTLPSPSA
jgi:signal transduction histidine kinase